jgi:hypothetical protein
MVEDLQLTLEKKEEEHESVRRREERTRKHVEDENDELRRKAALGWMLGCLSGRIPYTQKKSLEQSSKKSSQKVAK